MDINYEIRLNPLRNKRVNHVILEIIRTIFDNLSEKEIKKVKKFIIQRIIIKTLNEKTYIIKLA